YPHIIIYLLFCRLLLPPSRRTLFPYTTLFRSQFGIDMNVVTADATVARNLMLVVERCHLNVEAMAASPYVAALSVLTTAAPKSRSEEHTSELQSRETLVCRLLLEKKKKKTPYL